MLRPMQGEEVFSNYGHKSNEELILSYGFVIPNNPADFVHVSLGFSADDTGKDVLPCILPLNRITRQEAWQSATELMLQNAVSLALY